MSLVEIVWHATLTNFLGLGVEDDLPPSGPLIIVDGSEVTPPRGAAGVTLPKSGAKRRSLRADADIW